MEIVSNRIEEGCNQFDDKRRGQGKHIRGMGTGDRMATH